MISTRTLTHKRWYHATYESNHGQVPGSSQSRLGSARVLGSDERYRAVSVELRHRSQRLKGVCLVVVRLVRQPAGARSTEQVVVGTPQRVIDSADEVLALSLVQ